MSTPASNSKNQSRIRNMVEGVSVLNEGIVNLDGTLKDRKGGDLLFFIPMLSMNMRVKILGIVGKSLLQMLI